MNCYGVKIIGTGSYLPDNIVTNKDMEKYVETSDEWISSRTGIKERRFVTENESTSTMAYEACKKAIENANIDKKEIDLLVMCTFSPDYLFPATGCIVADMLGLNKAPAFDLEAACSGFVYGLTVGAQFIKSGMYKNVLVCGSDANSRVIDFQDRGTCVLFGDGAGAVVLSQTSIENNGFLNSFLGSDGSGAKHLEMKAGGSKYPASIETVQNRNHYLTMNGKEIYKFAVDIIPKCIENVIKGTDVTHDQIDYLIPHQANVRIIEGAAKRINLSMDKVHINLDKYGNTSSGTIPIALDEALKNKKIKKGDNIVLIGFGGGLTWGSALIKWV